MDDEVNKIKNQIETLNDEHVKSERLQRRHQDLIRIGEKNVWHAFLPCSVVEVFHDDRSNFQPSSKIFQNTHSHASQNLAE